MAQELISGKRFFLLHDGAHRIAEIYYDAKAMGSPFRIRSMPKGSEMKSSWDDWGKDIWEEIKPRHVHQDLIDSYQEGQAWQYRPTCSPRWENCRYRSGGWFIPEWREGVDYRLHPHNELIQAHSNGAEIQYYTHGDDEYCWVDDPTPCWDTYLMYRIKPKLATLYEWMVRKHGAWHVQSELCTESEAPSVFSAGYIVKYRKTGRSWEL
jgi:hypothetical protein